jgi:hypothetical protein
VDVSGQLTKKMIPEARPGINIEGSEAVDHNI